MLIDTEDLDVAASESGRGTQQFGATGDSSLEADESDTDDMLTDVGNHDASIGLRHLDDDDWIDDDADNWAESDDEYSEPNDGIHGSNNGDNINRARLVRVLLGPSADAVQAQQGREESKGGNADDCDETEPTLAEAPAPAATPVESHAPAAVPVEPPAPATAPKRGKRGAARCASKRAYDQSSWCSNCVTLNAMTTKPRGAAKSYPCTGLQVATEAPAPPPPLTELSRAPVPRNMFEPSDPTMRDKRSGHRRYCASASASHTGVVIATEPTGLDAAFAKGAAAKIYTDLARQCGDSTFVTEHVRPVIDRLVSNAAAARQSAREATSKAHTALAAEAHAKRLLAKVLNDDKRLARHRPVITELVGSGFGTANTLREHASNWVQKIEAAYAGDTWKQMQLAAALAERLALKKSSFERPADKKVVAAVIASLRMYYHTLRQRHAGRYPNDVRAAKMGVDMAVSIAVGGCQASLSAISETLGADRSALGAARKHWLAWCKGDGELLVAFRGRVRADKTPEDWVEFVRRAWLEEEITRAAESSHDSLRNPHDKNDKESYRIHWLEMRRGAAVKKIQELGKAQFPGSFQYSDGRERPDGFELSYTIIMFIMPFQVKPAGRHVCLCRYHLQWQYMVEGYYNYRVHLRRVNSDVKRDCKCELTSNAFDFRRTRVCSERGVTTAHACRHERQITSRALHR